MSQQSTFMERFLALENQSYILYLQLNALTHLLVSDGILDKKRLIDAMDEFDKEIQSIAKDIQDEEKLMENPAGNA